MQIMPTLRCDNSLQSVFPDIGKEILPLKTKCVLYNGVIGTISEFVGQREYMFEALDKFLHDILVMNVQSRGVIG